MPLLRRRPVQLLPVPPFEDSVEGEDPPVYFLKATGEIFKDYESYAARLSFLLTRQFQCEYSGKTNLDYFSALQSEKEESRVVRERFPDVLKGRVLATVQFRVMGRLDSLVDLVFERYKDRYFPDEQCFVDLGGDKYFAKISTVFPPQAVRDAAYAQQQAEAEAASAFASTSALDPSAAAAIASASSSTAPLDYGAIAHRTGIDLNVDAKKARSEDDPDEYLYTLQLMDEEHKFEGSTMEVRAKSLSRDRLTFSKSILKRYLRECLLRDAQIGSPWIVKPSLARMFGIPQQQSGTVEERNREAREAKLAKRRKVNPDGTEAGAAAGGAAGGQGPAKRRKTGDGVTAATGRRTSTLGGAPGSERGPAEPKPKAIKYPIEDLDLDPMSIHDGRILRRINAELPPLPPKPQPKRALPVPPECFERFVETWNALNIFARPLNLSTFSMDDYAGALSHATLTPRCVLLVEIHASLTNVLGTDGSRVLGSTTAVPSRRPVGGPESDAAARVDDDDGEDQLDGEGTPAPSGSATGGGEAYALDEADGEGEVPYEETELNKLVRMGIAYAKRWDRQAKLKYAEGREGWERHLVGALCQRGGPVHMPNFVRIMRHLFAGHPELPEQDAAPPAAAEATDAMDVGEGGDVKPAVDANGTAAANGVAAAVDETERPARPSRAVNRPQEEAAADDSGGDDGRVEQQYLSLSLEDKLDIVAYLVTLVMGTKVVRAYIDESELKLTELRKQRADVNKEKKALLEQKAAQENGGVAKPNGAKAPGAAAANGTSAQASASTPATPTIPATPSNGTANPMDAVSAERPKPSRPAAPAAASAGAAEDDEEEDQLASDDNDADDGTSSIAPSEAGSMAPGSRRQSVLEEKRLEKLRGARSGSVTSSTGAGPGSRRRGASTLEEQLRQNAERDDETEREFRRYQGVTRCRPLGRDRFHCRYWFFDGIGGMNLAGTGKGEVAYGTGRLFVQGPSVEDWELVAGVRDAKEEVPPPPAEGSGTGEGEELTGGGDDVKDGGVKGLLARRMNEEVVETPGALLGPDEWAFYEDEEELDSLVNWLNSKGVRELALKNALTKWRPFIVAGAKKRQFDAGHPDLPRYDHGGRRSSRKDPVLEMGNTYLGWRNSHAKF